MLISVKSDKSRVAKELLKLEEVKNIHLLDDSEYDIIAHVVTDNLINLRELSMQKISQVKDVRNTTTLIIAEELEESSK